MELYGETFKDRGPGAITLIFDYNKYLGLDTRKLYFVACKQQRYRSAYASAQSGQHPCYSLSGIHV